MDTLTKERLKVYLGVRPWTRHSLVLFVASLVYFGLGYAYYSTLLSLNRQEALSLVLDAVPLDVWGIVFMSSSVLVALSSRWPRISEKWGYTILTALSSAWAAAYGLGILFDGAELENLPAFLTWILVAFLWWAISGLVNPPQTLVVDDGSG